MKLSDIHLALSKVRKEQELSQTDIATALNVEQATVSLYETGKRGIPLALLDEWLQLLKIEITITPKGFAPAKTAEETKGALEEFCRLKKRRNYLIAELRAMMAEAIMQVSEFQQTQEETGESLFWPYSFPADPSVGLVETRYDHPDHKYLAVEYTKNEVNVYRFLAAHEAYDGEGDQIRLNTNRVYFSEDDFLTLGGQWGQDSMEMRKMTILRRNTNRPGGIEIIDPEGFSLQTLLNMQENYIRLAKVIEQTEKVMDYKEMEDELDEVMNKLGDLSLNNRLVNGTSNPDFIYWTDEDKEAVDVPLWDVKRNWSWIEEGVSWKERFQEIQILGDETTHELFHTHCQEDGSRVIGLIGADQKPAVFKSNPNRPNTIYRVAVGKDSLSDQEVAAYESVLTRAKELEDLRKETNWE